MAAKQLAKEVKAFLTKNGIKSSVRSERKTVYITYKTEISNELHDKVVGMQTLEAHGDTMNDTRYYTGVSFTFYYSFDANTASIDTANQIINNWGGIKLINGDHSKGYHANKDIVEAIGYPAYRAFMKVSELKQVW